MKLLLLCPHFEPDLHAATGEVMTKLVKGLADRGHHITVVSSLPWYHGHRVAEEWRGRPWRTETTDWGRILRCWPFPTTKNNIPARALGFLGQTTLATALAATTGDHDVVMGMSPPIFLGDAAWVMAKRCQAPFVFNTQDIFPDIAVSLGALTDDRIIALARRHETSIYRRADAITVLSSDQAANVSAKLATIDGPGGDPDKVHIIHNFVDLERIRPVERNNSYRRRYGLEGKTVVMYSGNVGLSQSFELIHQAALHWVDDPSIQFVVNGEGAAHPAVAQWAGPLPNVTMIPFGPRSDVPEILGAADLHLILLRKGLAASSTPSKLYGILAAGRPVLAAIDAGSEVCNVVREAGCGLSVEPDDPWAFNQALEKLLTDPNELQQMGRRGRAHAESCLSPQAQAEAYEDLFQSLVADRNRT
ncbi:MAG: glycosyltransferase family 4 protein [Acidimicrobiia bacterium]|nr:glycosyltransferase family 4 protein [Acidimicrobiia bacterium]